LPRGRLTDIKIRIAAQMVGRDFQISCVHERPPSSERR
jgi:hypothetical protein